MEGAARALREVLESCHQEDLQGITGRTDGARHSCLEDSEGLTLTLFGMEKKLCAYPYEAGGLVGDREDVGCAEERTPR